MEQENHQKLPENPRESANFFSIITFYWTIGLFRKGYKKDLKFEDLYRPLKSDESSRLGDRLEKFWNLQSSPNRSLLRAIAQTFWREYLFLAVHVTLNDILIRISLSLFLGRLLDFFSPTSTVSKQSAFIDAAVLLILTAINVIAQNQYLIAGYATGMKVRLATCSLIYRKSLRLSSTALSNTSVGKVVNLLSNDVSRFDLVSIVVHYLWLAPLLAAIVAAILYYRIGTAGLIGMLVIAIVTPLQSYTGKLASRFRLATAIRTDERVRLMDEIVNGIEVIKLYAWEKYFKQLIGLARDAELCVIRKSSYVRALYMTFMLFTTRSAVYCTMLAIVLLGEDLTASKVFVVSSLYQIVASVLSQMFVRGVAEVAEGLVAVRRLQSFLEHDEKEGGVEGNRTEEQKWTLGSENGRNVGQDGEFGLKNEETRLNGPKSFKKEENIGSKNRKIKQNGRNSVHVEPNGGQKEPIKSIVQEGRDSMKKPIIKEILYLKLTKNQPTLKFTDITSKKPSNLDQNVHNTEEYHKDHDLEPSCPTVQDSITNFKNNDLKPKTSLNPTLDPLDNIKKSPSLSNLLQSSPKFHKRQDSSPNLVKIIDFDFDCQEPNSKNLEPGLIQPSGSDVKDCQETSEISREPTKLFVKSDEPSTIPHKTQDPTQPSPNYILTMDNVTSRWKNTNGSQKAPTLASINLKIPKGSLIGVIGHVGAGKSSLLQVILKELPIEAGRMSLAGQLSFAPQEPWVFSGSIRQNILFGSEMDWSRYDRVVRACDMLKDFHALPFGDQTLIGERGSSLSGGQKARLSLARSLYRKADLYLLDDPLSAVDAHVGRHLFEECLARKGLLGREGATRVLVTHQVHFLKNADWVVLLKDGRIERQGCARDMMEDEKNLTKLVTEQQQEVTVRKRTTSRSLSRTSSIISSVDDPIDFEDSQDHPAASSDSMPKNIEESSKGKVKGNVGLNYLKAGASTLKLLLVLFLFLVAQTIASLCDLFVSFWTNQEELRTSSSEPTETYATELLEYVGGGLIIALLVAAIVRSIYFYTLTISASRNLHQASFDGVVSTKMRFFDLNPSGRVLNRFSKDLGAVDELLPKCLLDSMQVILTGLGTIVVTATVNPWFLLPIGILLVIFGFLRSFFLKTSKNLKRLEGTTRSPAFVHLAATINGLSTVRAFGAQDVLIREFDQHQDNHTGAWYLYICTSQAFGFALDVLCTIFVACVTLSFLIFDTMTSTGSSIGLAITQAMALTNLLQWGVRQSAEVMNQMMAVERILEYRELEPEQGDVTKTVGKEWPVGGEIEFGNVVYRYAMDMEPALKGVTFVVKSGEKIGIVGRTGAGKSSLIGSIFRMAHVEGKIMIDGVETSTISLAQLRSKVSIIPQDPVLFSGTLRKNLDPFEDFKDETLWAALADVKLKDTENLKLYGLQTLVATAGANFSVGQRQLICLARAILRQNKILVLDEATANVDPETDVLIQQTIREKFVDCTVLTIAHRLHTVMDSDRILVMDFGKVAEFDEPRKLVRTKGGIFRGMVNAGGTGEAGKLIGMMGRRV